MNYAAVYRGRELARFSTRGAALLFADIERYCLEDSVVVGRVKDRGKYEFREFTHERFFPGDEVCSSTYFLGRITRGDLQDQFSRPEKQE